MQIETRNVIDFYKYWETEAIFADLQSKHNDFSVLITNKFNDFNIGSVIRNANAFCAKEVIIYGRRSFDRRGCVGAHNYLQMRRVKFVEELNFKDCFVVGIDNIKNSKPIEDFIWPTNKHVVMAFGQENGGLCDEIISLCDELVYIKQYGSVRCLNVGCASSVAMYDYCRKVKCGET
jgi:tRNA G18 (ribose-2'-O)-methylase SpoU